LPLVHGKAAEIDFVDKNARLAARYMKALIAEAKTQCAQRASCQESE
jgi:hypothetical protein